MPTFQQTYPNLSFASSDFSNACFHLYPILVPNRKESYFKARESGLGLKVHYIPVPTQKYYRDTFGYKFGDYPKAEEYYAHCISPPLYPDLTDEDLEEIVRRINGILVSISIVPAFRGRGLTKSILCDAMSHVPSGTVVAEISTANEASRRLFVSVGFIVDDTIEAPIGFRAFKKNI